MRRPARDTRRAIDAFIAKKAEIDAMLARIAKLSEDHFDADPDKVNWGMSEPSRTMPASSGTSPTPPSGRANMPNVRSAPEKVFSYGAGIFGRMIECYRIGDEFFLYGVTRHGDARVLPSIGMAREVAASALP